MPKGIIVPGVAPKAAPAAAGEELAGAPIGVVAVGGAMAPVETFVLETPAAEGVASGTLGEAVAAGASPSPGTTVVVAVVVVVLSVTVVFGNPFTLDPTALRMPRTIPPLNQRRQSQIAPGDGFK